MLAKSCNVENIVSQAETAGCGVKNFLDPEGSEDKKCIYKEADDKAPVLKLARNQLIYATNKTDITVTCYNDIGNSHPLELEHIGIVTLPFKCEGKVGNQIIRPSSEEMDIVQFDGIHFDFIFDKRR